MDNAEILTEMGFEHVTGEMWKHFSLGYINVSITASIEDIAKLIFTNGVYHAQKNLKKALGL